MLARSLSPRSFGRALPLSQSAPAQAQGGSPAATRAALDAAWRLLEASQTETQFVTARSEIVNLQG